MGVYTPGHLICVLWWRTKQKQTPKPAPKHGDPLFGRELLYVTTVRGLYTFTMQLFSPGFVPVSHHLDSNWRMIHLCVECMS